MGDGHDDDGDGDGGSNKPIYLWDDACSLFYSFN